MRRQQSSKDYCFFKDTATAENSPLALHDALPTLGDRHPTEEDRCPTPLPRFTASCAPCARGRRATRRSGSAASRARSIGDRKSTRLNSSHANISSAVFCFKKKSPHYLAFPLLLEI